MLIYESNILTNQYNNLLQMCNHLQKKKVVEFMNRCRLEIKIKAKFFRERTFTTVDEPFKTNTACETVLLLEGPR